MDTRAGTHHFLAFSWTITSRHTTPCEAKVVLPSGTPKKNCKSRFLSPREIPGSHAIGGGGPQTGNWDSPQPSLENKLFLPAGVTCVSMWAVPGGHATGKGGKNFCIFAFDSCSFRFCVYLICTCLISLERARGWTICSLEVPRVITTAILNSYFYVYLFKKEILIMKRYSLGISAP